MVDRTTDGDKGDFIALARTRRSIRRYKPDSVPEEVLLRILEAARWAPSAVNSQPWHFLVITDRERRRSLGRRARWHGIVGWSQIERAPVVVAILGDPRGNRWYVTDCSLAGANLMLAAHALGLGTCWIGGFEQAPVRSALGVPTDREIIGLVTLGYPDEDPKPPPRLPLDRIMSREVFDPGQSAGLGERLRYSGLFSLRKRIWRMLGFRG